MRTSELYRFFFCVVKTESECPKNECVLASCIEFLVLPFLCVLSRMYTYQVYVCFVVKIPSDLISYAGPPEPSTQSKLLVVKVGFVGSGFARIPSLVRLLCRF